MIKTSIGRDFILDASLGRIPGWRQFFLIGDQDDIDIADGTHTIWDVKNQDLTKLSATTELFMTSDNAADTDTLVLIVGLDTNFNQVEAFVSLNGQTPVTTGSWIRILSMICLTGTLPVGSVYLAFGTFTTGVPDTAANIQSKIIINPETSKSRGITHNGFWTIPAGFAAITMGIRGTTNANNKIVNIITEITPFGGLPVESVEYSLAPNIPEFTFPAPVATSTVLGTTSIILDEKTDIQFLANAESADTKLFFGVDYLVARREYFGL